MKNNTSPSAPLFLSSLPDRHSEYVLTPEWVVPQQQVEQLLGEILTGVPSAYNSQPVRIVLLTGAKHREHWQLIEQALVERIGRERYDQDTAPKVDSAFKSGIATILFFDDTEVTKGLREQMPRYAENFALWAREVQGSHQFMTWLGLSELGFGCNLQHYTGMVDDEIRALAGVPEEWALIAQMPFGKVPRGSESGNKEKLPLSETLRIL